MFGQPSEILVMGVPHADGGVIPGDTQESQATDLAPVSPIESAPADAPKPQRPFDQWLAADLRLAQVVEQTEATLHVRASAEGATWVVPLTAALGLSLTGQSLVVARDPADETRGHLPMSLGGVPLLAQPSDGRVQLGAKVY